MLPLGLRPISGPCQLFPSQKLLKITVPSGSCGLPQSLETKVRHYHHKSMAEPFTQAVMLVSKISESLQAANSKITDLSSFLSQFLLDFGFLHVVLGLSLLPLHLHPLPLFFLSLFLHFCKLPFHTTWINHTERHKTSGYPHLPHRSVNSYIPPCVLPVILGT